MDVSIDQRAMAAQESQEGAFLVIHNVHKRYNGVHALRELTLRFIKVRFITYWVRTAVEKAR